MAPKLKPEEIVTLLVLKRKGQANTQVAQALGVSEGTVRYHARRADRPDGKQRIARQDKEARKHKAASSERRSAAVKRERGPRQGRAGKMPGWPRMVRGCRSCS